MVSGYTLRVERDNVALCAKKKDYLQNQIGNPEGAHKPNKKVSRQGLRYVRDVQYYDPCVWVHKGEKTMTECVLKEAADLGSVGA